MIAIALICASLAAIVIASLRFARWEMLRQVPKAAPEDDNSRPGVSSLAPDLTPDQRYVKDMYDLALQRWKKAKKEAVDYPAIASTARSLLHEAEKAMVKAGLKV